MKEKVYVMTFAQGVGSGTRQLLHSLGAIVHTSEIRPRELTRLVDRDIVCVFVSETGRFPSRHIRNLSSLAQAKAEGFEVPEELCKLLEMVPARLIAIKASSPNGLVAGALQNAHQRDANGAWLGDKKKRKSRRHVLEMRRRERFQDQCLFALP